MSLFEALIWDCFKKLSPLLVAIDSFDLVTKP